MNLIALLLIFFLNSSITASASIYPTQLADDVSINCGSNGAPAARDGREWHGDVRSKFSSLLQIKGSSTATSVIHSLISTDDPVPYTTARVSRYWFSYAFQVNPGQKVLRFHFNPASYKGVDLFSVEVGPFTLLSNFSASLTANALGVNSFVKEFCVNIQENKELNIVFSPESTQSFDTYAFINGIEIISVPTSLSYFREGGDNGVQVVGRSLVGVHSSTALEIIRQSNLEQDFIPSGSGIRGMFAMWETVSKRKARKTNDIAWKTSVDVGFRYLVRLHFSDVRLRMAGIDGVAFEVQINDMIAVTNIDLISERDDKNIKDSYKDYIVMINGQKHEGKQDLLICLHSNEEFMDAHSPLKGFEIMKLSNPDNSLACPNPLPSAQDSSCWSVQRLHQVLGHKNVIATVAVALLTLVNIIVHTSRIIWEVSGSEKENMPSARAQRICRQFSLGEILLATRNFSDTHLIGKGGFGKVYKGLIDNSQQTVAIKGLKPNSKQGANEFLTEIETLTKLCHVNLVSLIGYCNEHGEMILVYEYMACGTMADCLYKHEGNCHNCSSITWKQRLSICIGAARGLDYLHTGNSLIHRDVKASNILLDENMIAKVSDFGLAKFLNRSKLESHVSTKVKGTYWYMDPSYVTTGKLTRKSDTYAFGVLLFEVLSGRPAVDKSVAHDERVLISWARENISLGRADKIVASNLRGEISEDSLKAFVGIAERCVHGEPNKRPTMAQVVLQLEFALEQQESSKCLLSSAIKSGVDDMHPSIEETIIPVNTKKLTNNHTCEKNHVHPDKEQAMNKMGFFVPPSGRDKEQAMNKMGFVVPPSGRKNVQKDIIQKPSWFRRWDVLLNRENSLMKMDKTSGNHATRLVQQNEHGVYIPPVNASAVPLDELKDRHNINMLPISIPAIPADELKEITDVFGSKCSILEGFCGRVYYGVLKNGQAAAVKKLESRNQPYQEFLAKASMLCSLRVLAYEFAPQGSLYDVLHGQRGINGSNPGPTLSWAKRVNIAVGAAKGLEYIHDKSQIHGGAKSRNILLFDDNEVAKITDLDICSSNKISNFLLGLNCFISGGKYVSTGQRSWTSDVYSFGLILLELLTGRKPIDHARPIGQQDLVQWAKPKLREGKVDELVDARLNGNYPPEAVDKMAEVAGLCMKDETAFRPKMSAVVEALEPLLNTARRDKPRIIER